jgi:hypothetical protein
VPDAPENGYLRPAIRTAVVAITLGWAVSALVMAVSGSTDLRIPARIWLVGHGSGLTAGAASVGVVPISVTALFVLLTAWAARRATRSGLSDLGQYVGFVGAFMGIVAAVLSVATTTDAVSTSVARSAVGGFAVGGLGSALGAGWRYRDAWEVPETVALVARGATRAVSVVLGASLVLLLILLTVHGDRAGNMWALLGPSFLGGFALALACIMTIPTLVLWVAAVLVGPGFAMGSGTSVDLTGSHVGLMPSFPTLAAVPDPGLFPPLVLGLGLILPLAGVWAGAVTPRIRIGAAAGVAAGLVLGALIGMSGGGIGPGHMAEAGPPPVTPLVVAALVLGTSGALGSLLAHYRGRRVSRVPSAFGGLGVRRRDKSSGADRRNGGS